MSHSVFAGAVVEPLADCYKAVMDQVGKFPEKEREFITRALSRMRVGLRFLG